MKFISEQWRDKVTFHPENGTIKLSHLNQEQLGTYTCESTTAQYRYITQTKLPSRGNISTFLLSTIYLLSNHLHKYKADKNVLNNIIKRNLILIALHTGVEIAHIIVSIIAAIIIIIIIIIAIVFVVNRSKLSEVSSFILFFINIFITLKLTKTSYTSFHVIQMNLLSFLTFKLKTVSLLPQYVNLNLSCHLHTETVQI